ncbi:Sel1-like repeat protein [Rhizophagus clarus]|uniref:Sel1-like repeat protein n=1 Tax=Rhizophagus clarus TaxID=94130 RepID=A0A8H3LW17_9GLOM|nr:Sel1-like repeat protein [Rhizophagus clarus]
MTLFIYLFIDNDITHNIVEITKYYLYLRHEVSEKDSKKAIYWLQKVAANGSVFAYDNLANMRYDLEIDKQKGFELFNEAVDKGNINVLNYQKSIYENEELIVKDLNEINYWYQRSAENDNKIALYKQVNIEHVGELYIFTYANTLISLVIAFVNFGINRLVRMGSQFCNSDWLRFDS